MASPDAISVTGPRTVPPLESFVALISSLSARLAAAGGARVGHEVDACLEELLSFFGVDQCGILEVQPDVRQARLRHVASLPTALPAPTTVEYGTLFPWTHARSVIRGETSVQRRVDDLPPDAAADRASCAAMRIECIVAVPIGLGGQVTHVLCLTDSRPTGDWPDAVLAWLRTIGETIVAVLARHDTEQALRESERGLAEAQRVAGVGSFVRDWRDDTLLASDQAHRIFGLASGETLRDLLDFVHADDYARVEETLRKSLAQREPACELDYRIVRPDGEVRAVRSGCETTYDADGAPLRTVATIHDVSRLRQAEDEARRLRAELRHADRAAHLGALVASLSHELSQPLTGILANAQAGLQRLRVASESASELRAILEAIVRDERRAAAVVTNLRAMLRREEAPRADFDVAGAVAEMLELFRSEIEARHVAVAVDLAPGSIACADRTQIQQVVLNLLSNALHAVEPCDVDARRVVVALARCGPDRVEVSVRDSGRGIPPARLGRIFEPFFTTRPDGLGMGLAISRSIVEAHGGTIVAGNHADGGANVRFTLPARFDQPRTPDAADDAERSRLSSVALREAEVCIVDDDSASRDGIARLLDGAGWSVAAFGSAAAALDHPLVRTARCLLLDVQMPGMSGLALHAELARRGVAAPAVFLTARGDAATGVEAMKQGAVEYLTKPVDERVLVDAVRRAVDAHAGRAFAARRREELQRRLGKLTPRELDVMRCVLRGRLNKQIAAELAIAEATVKQHRGQVMAKMEVRSVAELVRISQEMELPPAS